MKTDIKSAVVLTVYCPASTNQTALEEFTKEVGGASVTPISGYWMHPDNVLVVEASNKWDWVIDEAPVRDIADVGKAYLRDNPKELEFMATAHIGDKFRVIKISRAYRSEILGI